MIRTELKQYMELKVNLMAINKNTKYGLLIVGLFSVFVLGIILSNFSVISTENNTVKNDLHQLDNSFSSEPLNSQESDLVSSNKSTISISGSLIYLNFSQLNEQSKIIVIGTVKDILPSKWNTADGKRRSDVIDKLSENDTIYTDIIVSVNKYLKNPLNQTEVLVRVQGGEDDIVKVNVDYEPTFKAGEKVLLYLQEDTYPLIKNIGPDHYVVTGYSLGKFSLTDNGMAIRPYEFVDQKELLDSIEKGYEPTLKSTEEVKE